MVYVGMDVHRKRTQVAVVGDDGKEVLNRSVANRAEELAPLVGSLAPHTPVAFEAAYGWGWVVELLEHWDLDPHLAHPLRCKAIASARLKNDKVDARTLAHLLRADLLPEAWIAPKEVRDLRTKLRFRVRLRRTQGAFRNRIHALLADHGIAIEPDSLWTTAGRAWLEGVELPGVSRAVVNDSVAVIDAVEPLVSALDMDIRKQAEGDPRVDALTTVYGIGVITAMTLVAEIGDIERFLSPRKLCAWAGFTPTVRNSADKIRHGHITKQGSVWVRWVLIEAAHRAKSKPPYAASYAAMARRRGQGIATVAIARKLLTRCFWLLKEAS
jgi:transposase